MDLRLFLILKMITLHDYSGFMSEQADDGLEVLLSRKGITGSRGQPLSIYTTPFLRINELAGPLVEGFINNLEVEVHTERP